MTGLFNPLRLLGVLLMLLMVGCFPAPGTPLKLGTNLWPGYEPLYLARERGLLADDQIVLVELLSASEVMRAFRNGAIDAAALTLDEVISLRAAGLKPVIVQVADISRGADVIMARPDIASIEALRGRRVGVEATALGAYMLSRALDLHGMQISDVEVVQLEVNEHRAAYEQGGVDAVVTFEPVRQQLLDQGAVVLFDSSMIPGEIVDVIVVREALLDSHQDQVQHLIRAWQRSLDLLREQPQASARLMAQRLKLTPQEVLASYAGMELPDRVRSRALLGGANPPLQRQARQLAAIMRAHTLIDAVPDLEGLIYSRYPDR